jgi:hypothetical protein
MTYLLQSTTHSMLASESLTPGQIVQMDGFFTVDLTFAHIKWATRPAVLDFLLAIVIAQICISAAWLLVNNHVTRMWQETEWVRFFQKSDHVDPLPKRATTYT